MKSDAPRLRKRVLAMLLLTMTVSVWSLTASPVRAMSDCTDVCEANNRCCQSRCAWYNVFCYWGCDGLLDNCLTQCTLQFQ
jgi:hypothetical protein